MAHEPGQEVEPSGSFRIEHDSMGEVEVPADALWAAQTQRAVQNFPISGRPIDPRLVRALALIKAEAATVNARFKDVPAVTPAVAAALTAAALTVANGDHDAHFPVDVFQTGSGTSSNMNANEVIAHLASEILGEPVHPNDQV
ncbi:MAG: lyase family protein, partial [Aquihabitans sp.]